MNVEIRPLAVEDAETARTVIRAVWDEHFRNDPDEFVRTFMVTPDTLADLSDPAFYDGRRATILGVFEDDRLVGTGAVAPAAESVCELRRMFLLTAYRGAGLGRRLAEQLVEFARAAGYERIRLGSHKSLIASHRLYRRLGFQDIEPYEEGGGKYAVYMELDLRDVPAAVIDPPAQPVPGTSETIAPPDVDSAARRSDTMS